MNWYFIIHRKAAVTASFLLYIIKSNNFRHIFELAIQSHRDSGCGVDREILIMIETGFLPFDNPGQFHNRVLLAALLCPLEILSSHCGSKTLPALVQYARHLPNKHNFDLCMSWNHHVFFKLIGLMPSGNCLVFKSCGFQIQAMNPVCFEVVDGEDNCTHGPGDGVNPVDHVDRMR